jgi:hypothetical protein
MGYYARWMDRWERHLASRDSDRVVRPFEWGSEWLDRLEFPRCHLTGDGLSKLPAFVAEALRDSDRFFAYETPRNFKLEGARLTFRSPVDSGYPENDIVHALWMPAASDRGRALVVLPQWNSGPEGHIGLGKLLNRFGISALRLTMAYHAERKPKETARADYHVSSNIGRTIHASRQTVVDVRACLDWLAARGYSRLGVLGTSLGSCMVFLAAAHDKRVRLGIFNHVAMYVGDVVWTGLSTRHIRDGFGKLMSQKDLRHYWSVISPASFIHRIEGRDMRSLLIWAKHDSSFLPVYSRQVLDTFRELRLPHEVFTLPCGHYTTGRFPFNWMDGLVMCRFAARHL